MIERIDRYCLSCGNVTVVDNGYYAGSSFYQCETCGRKGTEGIFPKATVFHRITASPEVLAEKLVYALYGTYGKTVIAYFSTIIPGKSWKEKAEAIAATVAKLKESGKLEGK